MCLCVCRLLRAMNKLPISTEEKTRLRKSLTCLCVRVHVSTCVCVRMLSRSANKCTTKVAHMLAQLQKYERAADLFEEVRIQINP